jgi:hypothetical protein
MIILFIKDELLLVSGSRDTLKPPSLVNEYVRRNGHRPPFEVDVRSCLPNYFGFLGGSGPKY